MIVFIAQIKKMYLKKIKTKTKIKSFNEKKIQFIFSCIVSNKLL